MGETHEEAMRHIFTVPDSVTVRSAHRFAEDLLAEFDAERSVDLDLSALAEVDLAFIEIISAARQQWSDADRELRLAHPAGGAVVALLERAGFLSAPAPQDIEFWFHGELPQ